MCWNCGPLRYFDGSISEHASASMHAGIHGTIIKGLYTNKIEVELVFVLQISSTVARAQVRERILYRISRPL